MVSEKQGGGPTPPRRTPGDANRRRTLADTAAGMGPEVVDLTGTAVGRFRVVLYLCGASNADLSVPRDECLDYAGSLGWEVVAEFEDRDGLSTPKDREGLKNATERVRLGEAGAVLTPSRSMISPLAEEYAEVSSKIEKHGGFLQVAVPSRDRARVER